MNCEHWLRVAREIVKTVGNYELIQYGSPLKALEVLLGFHVVHYK